MCKLQYRIIPVLNIQSDCVGTWDIHNLPPGVWGLCTAALTRQMFCTFHILPSLSYVYVFVPARDGHGQTKWGMGSRERDSRFGIFSLIRSRNWIHENLLGILTGYANSHTKFLSSFLLGPRDDIGRNSRGICLKKFCFFYNFFYFLFWGPSGWIVIDLDRS